MNEEALLRHTGKSELGIQSSHWMDNVIVINWAAKKSGST